MACSCDRARVSVRVPDEYRDLLPDSPAVVSVCPRCFRVEPADDSALTIDPATSDTLLPALDDATTPMVLALALLSSMALYRDEIATLVAAVEAEGVDPLLVLDRIARDPDTEPAVDLTRRRRQLEQLLE
jgi:hypothetical protein